MYCILCPHAETSAGTAPEYHFVVQACKGKLHMSTHRCLSTSERIESVLCGLGYERRRLHSGHVTPGETDPRSCLLDIDNHRLAPTWHSSASMMLGLRFHRLVRCEQLRIH
jgi:hypothetical protein